MIFDKQPEIDYGFTDFNGGKWCNQFVDTYNQFTSDINKTAGIDIASDSLTMRGRDHLLDTRHKHFIHYMQLSSNKMRDEYMQVSNKTNWG